MSKGHLWSKSLDQLTVSNVYISSSTFVFIYNYFQDYLSCTRIDVNCAVHEANGRRLHLHLSASKAQRTSRRYYRLEDDHDRAPLIIRPVNYSPRQNQIVLLFHKTSNFSYERRHRARTCRNSIVRLPLVKRAWRKGKNWKIVLTEWFSIEVHRGRRETFRKEKTLQKIQDIFMKI